MDKQTFIDEFVKEFIEEYYDEERGDLENCKETAEMIAEGEYLVEYGYEEEDGLH
jgi:hypothetical protein